jgi:2-phospho-L-lactate guanylyltransferase
MAERRESLPEIRAIVPVKRLSLAKQRMAPVLSQSERTMLARVMLNDVLATLHATPELAGTIVISSDPMAEQLARQFDACIVSDSMETGVNDAVRQGLAILDDKTAALVVPADVPFATVDEIQAVIRSLSQHDVVLVPALSDGGTNALAVRSSGLIAPSFGEDSFDHHLAGAKKKSLRCGIVRCDGLGHDIDRPEDLVSVPGKNSLTAALLAEFDIAARLSARPNTVRCVT